MYYITIKVINSILITNKIKDKQ